MSIGENNPAQPASRSAFKVLCRPQVLTFGAGTHGALALRLPAELEDSCIKGALVSQPLWQPVPGTPAGRLRPHGGQGVRDWAFQPAPHILPKNREHKAGPVSSKEPLPPYLQLHGTASRKGQAPGLLLAAPVCPDGQRRTTRCMLTGGLGEGRGSPSQGAKSL